MSIQIPAAALRWLAAGLLGLSLVGVTQLASAEGDPDHEAKVLREGTRVESKIAIFRSAGDRLVVEFSEDSRTILVLENLAAQRIQKAILEGSADGEWVVIGTLTEFQDRNFILLERVTRAVGEQDRL